MSEHEFPGRIGHTIADSTPWWPTPAHRAQSRPNVLLVLFDDVGFSDFGCYGSPIRTPTIDALAAKGLRFSGFHTTAMCSTTRAALLTGCNHHSVGMGCLANFDSGYPGDRFYGFMDAETDQYAPALVRDNSPVAAPGNFASGYHLSADLVDGEPAGSLEMKAGFHTLISWSGLDIGLDRGSPVSHYEAPFEFTGKLKRVTVRLGPMPDSDDEAVAKVEIARQ